MQEVEYVKQEAKIVALLECLQKTPPPVCECARVHVFVSVLAGLDIVCSVRRTQLQQTHTLAHTHTHARNHTHTHTRAHTHTHTHARAIARTHSRMHAHTHMHARAHTQRC